MSLLFGVNKTGQKVHIKDFATQTEELFSPLGKPLVAKKGNIKVHHYAHKHREDGDPWVERVMCNWHRSYQEICLPEHVEVRIQKNNTLHIADIQNQNKLIIELQHSHIDDDEIKEREMFYTNMIWVFDYSSASTKPKGKILFDNGEFVRILLSSEAKNTSKPTFYDDSTTLYEYLGNEGSNKKMVWCKRMSHAAFVEKYMDGITTRQYTFEQDSLGFSYVEESPIRMTYVDVLCNGEGAMLKIDDDTDIHERTLRRFAKWQPLQNCWFVHLTSFSELAKVSKQDQVDAAAAIDKQNKEIISDSPKKETEKQTITGGSSKVGIINASYLTKDELKDKKLATLATQTTCVICSEFADGKRVLYEPSPEIGVKMKIPTNKKRYFAYGLCKKHCGDTACAEEVIQRLFGVK